MAAEKPLNATLPSPGDILAAWFAVAQALRMAREAGIDAEFVDAFGDARARGQDTYTAIRTAKREWDL